MRVLLVDDDRELAEYVRRELEEESLNVVVAHDGASALRLAETSAFDIIVLDVMMPFMDGLQATRSLRRQAILTPIFLLTARDAPEEIVQGLEARADDYVTKPFSFDVLLLRSAGRVVTRDRLIETVWSDREVSENNLDVFIKFVRSKVDVPGSAKLIHTERGLGYSLRQDAQ